MENINTIKESLIYSTLYAQTIPQNTYQHKSFCSFWSQQPPVFFFATPEFGKITSSF